MRIDPRASCSQGRCPASRPLRRMSSGEQLLFFSCNGLASAATLGTQAEDEVAMFI